MATHEEAERTPRHRVPAKTEHQHGAAQAAAKSDTPSAPWKMILPGFWLAFTALAVGVLIAGAGILIPLAIAVMVWFLINALASGLGKLPLFGLRLRYPLAQLVAVVILAGGLWAAGKMIGENVASLSGNAAAYEAAFRRLVDGLSKYLGHDLVREMDEMIAQISLAQAIGALANAFTNIAADFGIIVVYVLFLLVEQRSFRRKLKALCREPGQEEKALALLRRIEGDIQTYLWLTTALGFGTALLCYGIMMMVGLDYAALWAFLVFILSFVPTVGPALALVGPSLMALVQFPSLTPFLVIIIGIGVTQAFIANVVQPRLTSQSLNISAFVVILSLFVWNAIWGIPGMFLCVPIMVMVMIVLAAFPQTRPIAVIMSGDGNVR